MPTIESLKQLTAPTADPSIEGLRRRLRETLQSDKSLALRFDWVFPKAESTDDAVKVFLDQNPPAATLEPCLYRTHLTEASALLDRCLARRDQIYALESTAVTSALEYAFADATHAGELSLARLAVKAARNQGKADQHDADERVVDDQFALRTQALNARLALHAQDGNPLNYSQRINDLRDLFADDIRSVYERLHAARIGMHVSGAAPNLEPPPGWFPTRRNNLMLLVTWCREAIHRMELRSTRENVYRVAYFLKRDGLVSESEMVSKLAKDEMVSFKFAIGPQHIHSWNGPHRLLNVGMAVVFGDTGVAELSPKREYIMTPIGTLPGGTPPTPKVKTEPSDESLRQQWELGERKGFAFSIALAMPLQSCRFDPPGYPGEPQYDWHRPALYINREVTEWQGLAAQRYSVASGTNVLNTNPIGMWEAWLPDGWFTPSGWDTRGALRKTGVKRWQITDLVVYMTIASLGKS